MKCEACGKRILDLVDAIIDEDDGAPLVFCSDACCDDFDRAEAFDPIAEDLD